MKKFLLSTFTCFFISSLVFAQSGFKYQAIIRDATGNVNANASVNMEISILQGSADGTTAFIETHSVISNTFGLVNLTIGSQNPTDFNLIDWANGPYFIKIVVDGVEFGTSQLLSVPYALHAKTAENITGGINETDPNFINSQAVNITATDINHLANLSGVNTGDQDLSNLLNTEVDPVFNTSVAANISQEDFDKWTNKLDSFLESDPEFAASLANGITATDTAYWNSKLNDFVESDPTFMAHPSAGITDLDITKWRALWLMYTTNANGYLNAATPAGGISAADTANWNTTNYSELTNAPDLANTTNNKIIKLNTNDQNSSFEIQKSNGTKVLKVNGIGQMAGDGSGLSNVKSLINIASGDHSCQIYSNYGSYDEVRAVSLSIPSNGICFVITSGFVDWESKNWDLVITSILMDQDPNTSGSAENDFFNYTSIITDYNCTDSSDQYTSYAQHRSIPVSAGNHTFKLWANKYTSSAKVRLVDIQMTVIFIPTSGSGVAPKLPPITKNELELKSESLKKRIEKSISGDSPPHQNDSLQEHIKSQEINIRELQEKYKTLEDKLNNLISKTKLE